MEEGLLSMKWNNHRPSFFNLLKVLRIKGSYSDVTLACGSKFFAVHRLVLMACSDYFTEVLDYANCHKPVIVLKDIKSQELEALLDYMYMGEVDVQKNDLPGLIKAAECLKIKGLAVPEGDTLKLLKEDSIFLDKLSRKQSERAIKEVELHHISTDLRHKELTGFQAMQASEKEFMETQLTVDRIIVNSTVGTELRTTTSSVVTPSHDVATAIELATLEHDHTISPSQLHSQDLRMSHVTVEAYQESSEIKRENCEMDDERTNSKKHCTQVLEATDSGDLTHFLTATVEESLSHQMFSPTQHPGSSGLRTVFRDNALEAVSINDEVSRAVGTVIPQAMYTTSQIVTSELAPVEPSTSNHSTQANVVLSDGPVVRDVQGRIAYRCLYCPRIDTDKSKWRRHLRTHTGEKPFHCSKCPYKATTKHGVIRHHKFRHSTEDSSI